MKVVDCIENDMMSVGVQRRSNKTEDSSVWAIIPMGAVGKP